MKASCAVRRWSISRMSKDKQCAGAQQLQNRKKRRKNRQAKESVGNRLKTLRQKLLAEAIPVSAKAQNCHAAMRPKRKFQSLPSRSQQECQRILSNSAIKRSENWILFQSNLHFDRWKLTSSPSMNITLTKNVIEKPITSGHGSFEGAFRPRI